MISPRAEALIIRAEITSPAYYAAHLAAPSWPGGASGVTIGIGYDLGYYTAAEAAQAWGALCTPALAACCGVTGEAARDLLPSVARLHVPLESAEAVFRAASIPRAEAQTVQAFPGADRLPDDCYGALVSLVFNRGPRIDTTDRRREMRQIRAAVAGGTLELVPDLIRSMCRLLEGRGLDGLIARRHAEADLFAAGLAGGRYRNSDIEKSEA